MRICFYSETALPKIGGQELVIDALARQFLALGHEPLVLAPPPKNRPVTAHDAALPYPVVRHPRFFSTRYLVEWYAMFLRRAWRQHRFDVLHCHSIYPCAYLAALTKDRLGIPTVITSHGGDVHAEGRRLLKPGIPALHIQPGRGRCACFDQQIHDRRIPASLPDGHEHRSHPEWRPPGALRAPRAASRKP